MMQRRQFLSLAGLAILPMKLFALSRELTPRDAEGPFYPVEPIPLRSDLIGDEKALVGKAIKLDGRVVNQKGEPVTSARIEIWQCDGKGVYQHPQQSGRENFDPAFAGFGAQQTNEQGYYSFTTLYPAPYPGRPPHIHVKILRDNGELLTTQLYLEGKTGGWFSAGSDPQINPRADSNGKLTASFTFVVAA